MTLFYEVLKGITKKKVLKNHISGNGPHQVDFWMKYVEW